MTITQVRSGGSGRARVVLPVLSGLATAALALLPQAVDLSTAALVLITSASLAYLSLFASPTLLFSLCLVAQVLSGNSARLGFPIGPDRVLLLAALAALVREALAGRVPVALKWQPVHAVLLLLGAIAVASAAWSGTLTSSSGIFALLDRLGFVPFLAFFLAPLLFGTTAQRNVLLVSLVSLGGYLGVTGLLESLGLDALIWPAYITDPNVGLHFGRSRGPFAEAVAMGLALLQCAVACGVALRVWTRAAARVTAAAVGALCLVGTLFTLTRAVWLGTALGLLCALLADRRLRKWILPALVGSALLVMLALSTVPGLSDDVTSRSNDQRPIWDRYNTNRAAVAVIEDRPLTGLGWQTFATEGRDYLRQAADYPLTGADIEVHNVFLSHAAELGLPTAALYVLALSLAVVGGLRQRDDPERDPWRSGLLVLSIGWLTVAMFGPLSYALPNTLIWLWAGIVLTPALRQQRATP